MRRACHFVSAVLSSVDCCALPPSTGTARVFQALAGPLAQGASGAASSDPALPVASVLCSAEGDRVRRQTSRDAEDDRRRSGTKP